MKINTQKEKYIFIELTGSDMKMLDLSFDDMDYSDEKTRMIIFSVLNEAKNSLGQDFELSDTARVEALPRDDGGCLLFFTISDRRKRYLLKGNTSCVTFRFDSIDSLIDLSSGLSESERSEIGSSLFFADRRYYLRLSGRLHHSLIMKINEYAYPVRKEDGSLPLLCDEKCIIGENALEVLCGGVSQS